MFFTEWITWVYSLFEREIDEIPTNEMHGKETENKKIQEALNIIRKYDILDDIDYKFIIDLQNKKNSGVF